MLIQSFSEEEIKDTMWDCDSSKSPGLDGFNFSFMKFAWDIIKEDVGKVVKDFHAWGKWSRGSSASFISLIPKMDNPQHLNEYKPISLVYKILSKILSNRLKRVLHKVIDKKNPPSLKVGGY